MPRPLSIVIPHFNKQVALKLIHDELKLQIDPIDEIVVIDDFSTNPLPDFNCKCTRVVRPPNELNPHIYRLNTLRNLGVSEAKNDAIIIIDPDCLPNPTFITNARRIFDPSVLFAGRVDKIQKDGTPTIDPRTGEKISKWIDIDEGDKGGGLVWGGCMMFSKARASLVGLFDTDFDGRWGAEEHEFASRCYNSGMRIYYSKELLVTHQYHEKNTLGGSENMILWRKKAADNAKNLNIVTNYCPAVGVSVISFLRPNLIDQCLRAIFRNIIPLRVRLCINGDNSMPTREAIRPWKNRWAVELVNQERNWPAKIRNEAFNWAKSNNYKYLIFIDDDITVSTTGIVNLIRTMEKDTDIFACSGYLMNQHDMKVMLGGKLKDGAFSYLKHKPSVYDSDWVGGGFTIHRLDTIIPYDDNYETGYNDYDWSMEAIKQGKKLAVCGTAGAYHGVTFTKTGPAVYHNPSEYKKIRYDSARHERMAYKFAEKWGFSPRAGPLCEPN